MSNARANFIGEAWSDSEAAEPEASKAQKKYPDELPGFMIKPIGKQILVRLLPVEKRFLGDGSIILPDDLIEKEEGGRDMGCIVAWGPLAWVGYETMDGSTTTQPEHFGIIDPLGALVEFARYDGKLTRFGADKTYPEYRDYRYILANTIRGQIMNYIGGA
jgi:co-chaperonin GroES (HSP10)